MPATVMVSSTINVVKIKKLQLGLLYGAAAGLAFALFTWGVDAIILAISNAAFYWIKFLPGLFLCMFGGALVGWLTIRIENHAAAVLLWSVLGALFTWLSIWLAFKGSPDFIGRLNPNLIPYFDFKPVKDLYQFSLVSLVVIGLASILCGLLEINLIHQAMLSSNGLATFSAFLVCIFLFGVAGSATDQMINFNLREPVQEINKLLQFAQENAGKEVPRLTARKMHLSAVKQLDDIIRKDRQLYLSGYDENLGMMDVLVDFEGTYAMCTTIYAQATDCILVPQKP